MIPAFSEIVAAHRANYPQMQPQDYCKLAHQSAFGPEHLAADQGSWQEYLISEWQGAKAAKEPEPIGNGLCRFHLSPTDNIPATARLLEKLAVKTAVEYRGSGGCMEENLAVLQALNIPGMGELLSQYRSEGCPALHHSHQYRTAYAPHYRVIGHVYGALFPLLLDLQSREKQRTILAIDGRCGSGKTGIAGLIAGLFDCNVIHTDDYYLPFAQRRENWEQLPGGNIDFSRLQAELLDPAQQGKGLACRPFDCQTGEIRQGTRLPAKKLTIVEGSYSQHPCLREYYDLAIFLTCSDEVQAQRLSAREGNYYPAFRARWIPMEERYNQATEPRKNSKYVFNTNDLY